MGWMECAMWWWSLFACSMDSMPAGKVERTETGCNGQEVLCDRPLDQVTLAGTHNSMSNAEAGWLAPNQQYGLTRQLEDGIRALMLDTMEWNGEPYLCHGYCDLGSQPLEEGLAEIEAFMAENPREVILIVFQDSLSVEVTVEVMDSVGLSQRVWTWDGTASLPSLGELIDASTRLVVTAEHGGAPPGWYHHAWDLITDTPYDFSDPSEYSCERLRGEEENPLFLVNHWLGTPLPSEDNGMVANDVEALLMRVNRCRADRDRQVNILAVDFYNHGGLFAVVDELNGIRPAL
jgi:hypothetical protein